MKLLAAIAAVSLALPAVARVDAMHKFTPLNGHDDCRMEIFRGHFQNGNFDKCYVSAEYTVRGNEIVSERWAPYYFAIRLGYDGKNSGWSRWEFLNVIAKGEKGLYDVLKASRPVMFIGYSIGGSDRLAMDYLTESGRRVKLMFAAYPSHNDWLFLRVDFSESDIESINLNAYPGNAAGKEGRERRLATKEDDFHLNVERGDFKPKTPFVLLYSRYFDQHAGCKLVFEPSTIEEVKVGTAVTGIGMRFIPKKNGAKTAEFALGWFAHKDPDDQKTRFLGEDGDAIYDFLKTVEWDASPSLNEFKESALIAFKSGVAKDVLRPITVRYQAALKKRDLPTVFACEQEVMKLRRERTAAGLAEFMRGK